MSTTSAADDLRTGTAEAWRAFREVLQGVDLGGVTSAGWQVRELVAHVAFWMETVPPFVTGAFRGDPAAFQITFPSGYVAGDGDWPPADEHNAREAAWARQQVDDDVVLARVGLAYEDLAAFLETVTDDEATAQASYFAEIADHLDAHRRAELTVT